jgi:tetratricopeptide (TPR) repeat protein
MGLLNNLFGNKSERSKPAPPAASHAGSVTPAETARSLYEDGLRLIKDGHKREGLLRFTEAVKVDSHCVEAHVALASAFYMINPLMHSQHILSSANSALAVDPLNPKARNIAAATHFALGKQAWDGEEWDVATASFGRSYDLDPDGQHTAEALAHCAEQARQLKAAIQAFEERLANDTEDRRARYLAGRSYVKMALTGDEAGLSRQDAVDRGEAHLRNILRVSPSDPDANYWLGGAYLLTSRNAEASEIIELLRSIDPEKSAELAEMRDG